LATRQATCRTCGAQLPHTEKRGRPRKFCSTECLRFQKPALHDRKCAVCGKAFVTAKPNQRFCSGECYRYQCNRRQRVRTYPPTNRQIADSLRVFVRVVIPERKPMQGPPAPRVCACGHLLLKGCRLCVNCKAKRRAVWMKTIRKANKMRKRGATVEMVNDLIVLARDGWRCHLCGVKTPSRLRGTYDDRAPEVDHIVPIAAGGEHSYRNTACACRRCNIAKGARPLGQLRLL
jgi:predicted nucleic acid-binding Zn ribbon protein